MLMLASCCTSKPTWWCGMLRSTRLSVDGISWMVYHPRSDRRLSQLWDFWVVVVVVGVSLWTIWFARVWSIAWSTGRQMWWSRTACFWRTMKPLEVPLLSSRWREWCSSAMRGGLPSSVILLQGSGTPPRYSAKWKTACSCRTTLLCQSQWPPTSPRSFALPLHRMDRQFMILMASVLLTAITIPSLIFCSTRMTSPWTDPLRLWEVSRFWKTAWPWRHLHPCGVWTKSISWAQQSTTSITQELLSTVWMCLRHIGTLHQWMRWTKRSMMHWMAVGKEWFRFCKQNPCRMSPFTMECTKKMCVLGNACSIGSTAIGQVWSVQVREPLVSLILSAAWTVGKSCVRPCWRDMRQVACLWVPTCRMLRVCLRQ